MEEYEAEKLIQNMYDVQHSWLTPLELAKNSALVAIKFARQFGICEDQKNLDTIENHIKEKQV